MRRVSKRRARRRVLATACLSVTAAFAVTLTARHVWRLQSVSTHTLLTRTVYVNPTWDGTKVSLCHLADFHAQIESDGPVSCPNSPFNLTVASAYKLALDHHCSDEDDHHLSFRLFAGDLMAGSEYDDALEGSSLPARLLEYWDITAYTLGNHDFDQDWSFLDGMLSDIPVPLTNVEWDKKKMQTNPVTKRLLDVTADTVVLNVSNGTDTLMQVCLFGWVLDSLMDLAKPPPGYFKLTPYTESLTRALNENKATCFEKCSTCLSPPLRILLSHAGYGADIEAITEMTAGTGAAAVTGAAVTAAAVPSSAQRDLAKTNIDPPVHVILGGHSHTSLFQYPHFEHGVTVSHTGSHGRWMGVIAMELVESGEWATNTAESLLVPVRDLAVVEPAAVVDELCLRDAGLLDSTRTNILTAVRNKTQHVVADNLPTNFYSNSYDCRAGPCSLADLVTEAILRQMQEQAPQNCHFPPQAVLLGMETAGDLRSKLPAPCDSPFQKAANGCHGTEIVTEFDVDRILPFHSRLYYVVLPPGELCRVVWRSLSALYLARRNRGDGKMRSSAFVHFSGVQIEPNTELFEFLYPQTGELHTADANWFARLSLLGECAVDDQGRVIQIPNNTVVVGTTDWLATGGDGLLLKQQWCDSGVSVNEVVTARLRAVLASNRQQP